MQPIITTTETTLRGQSSILPPNILVALFCYIFSNTGVEIPADKGVKISRYRSSYDGGNTWGEWVDSEPNPAAFTKEVNDNFIFEFEKVDTSLLNSHPVFEKLFFSQFFDFYDDGVLNWAFNVLEKLYAPGIIPTYIERNLDFCSYWLAICHNFAFIEQYGAKFGQIDTNEILFNKFLNERGLITTTVDTPEQRQYLFNNYIEEYRKRGKLAIAEKGEIINGEFLRLIRYGFDDEFIFAVLGSKDTGWCVAHSSPMWSYLQTIEAVDKSKGDIARYPTTGSVTIANGVLYPNATAEGSGIGANTDNSLLFPLNAGKSYEISFLLRVSSDTANKIQNLKFGVDVFDVDYSPITCTMMNDTRDATNYFHTGELMPKLVNQNVKDGYSDFLVRAVVKNFAFNENFALRWPDGYALRWPFNAKWFTPKIVQVSGGDITPVQILNVTVKPQTLSYTDKTIPYGFSQGFMGTKNIIASFIVNNSYYSQSEIKEFTKRYLIDYKNIILIEYLSIGEEPYFMFSKHEDRLAAAGTPPVVNEIQTNKNWVLTLGN